MNAQRMAVAAALAAAAGCQDSNMSGLRKISKRLLSYPTKRLSGLMNHTFPVRHELQQGLSDVHQRQRAQSINGNS